MKKKIDFENLIASGLLKFGKIDNVDVTLIMWDVSKTLEVELKDDNINKYFIMSNGMVMLNEEYINGIYKGINNSLLERMSVSVVKEYLDRLNIEDFVLRKISLLGIGCVPSDDLIHNFSVIQLHAMKRLYEKQYIMNYLQEDMFYGDYQAVRLTKSGLVKLFVRDNYKEVKQFYYTLIKGKYDVSLFNEFLMHQNLDKDILDILKIDNFLEFCNIFDSVQCEAIGNGDGYSRKLVSKKNNGCF